MVWLDLWIGFLSTSYLPQYGCIVSGSSDGSLRVWSHKGTPITTLYGHTLRVNACDIFVKCKTKTRGETYWLRLFWFQNRTTISKVVDDCCYCILFYIPSWDDSELVLTFNWPILICRTTFSFGCEHFGILNNFSDMWLLTSSPNFVSFSNMHTAIMIIWNVLLDEHYWLTYLFCNRFYLIPITQFYIETLHLA